MFPYIKSSPSYTLNIPELSGGMNLRDGLSHVADNQLTDAKNMWFKDGALRTRPSCRLFKDNYWYSNSGLDEGSTQIYSDPQHIFRRYNQEYNFAVVAATEFIAGVGDSSHLRFLCFTTDNVVYGEPQVILYGEETLDKVIDNVLILEQNAVFYCFVSGHDFGGDDTEPIGLYQCDLDAPQRLIKMEDWQMYQPTVIINNKPSKVETDGVNGTAVYAYNILGDTYKIGCTLPEAIEGDLDTYYYTIPMPVSYSSKGSDGKKHFYAFDYTSGKPVTAVITYNDGSIATHTVNIGIELPEYGFMEGNQPNGAVNSVDGYKMCVRDNIICFYNASNKLVCPTVSATIQNNMTVTVPKMVNADGIAKIYNMRKSIWYGGTAEGLYGGTRLFLGGNTNKKDQALMIWSDLNNPLYFPEYNYAYVGNTSKALTAFGRQGETLVLLKDRELHQIPYVANVSVTVNDLMEQKIIDLASQTVAFPIYQIHGYIGCDCPDTVQLCRNRLVWANSDGKVYSLITENQFNERSVFVVSEMVENRLKDEKYLRSAHSADYDGFYCLFVGNRVYVMDYNSYGFSYVSSFSKAEDANVKIPWFYWELPQAPFIVLINEDKMVFPFGTNVIGDYGLGNIVGAYYIDGKAGKDDVISGQRTVEDEYILVTTEQAISSALRTKLFDFDQPSRLKSIPIVNLTFGYNYGAPIKVEFISDKQLSDEHEITIEGAEAEQYSPEYIHQCRLFPYTKGTVSFGAVISCEGELVLNSMTLQYKALGGAK